jgi:steroid delta-isomerase-like uncharacterized protein
MSAKNVEAIRNAHESWNRRDFAGILRNLADNFVYIDHPRNLTLNADQFKAWTENWAKAFSDGRIVDAQYIDAGDIVITQFTAEGTNDGPFGSLPPTGNRMSLRFCEIARLDKQGHTVSGEVFYDQYTLLAQLGHVKPLAAAA